MWIGSGFWLLSVDWQLHCEEVAAWTVAGAVGVLVILGFIWSMIYRFKLLRGIVAIIVNGVIGLIVAPVVIHLGLFILFVVLAGIALWIYSPLTQEECWCMSTNGEPVCTESESLEKIFKFNVRS